MEKVKLYRENVSILDAHSICVSYEVNIFSIFHIVKIFRDRMRIHAILIDASLLFARYILSKLKNNFSYFIFDFVPERKSSLTYFFFQFTFQFYREITSSLIRLAAISVTV